jgi:uncharacterized protein
VIRQEGDLEARIKSDAVAALKAGDKRRRAALNGLVAALKKERIDAGKQPGEAEELVALRREHKRRLEAAEVYHQGGRAELAEQETYEAELLAAYMPAELSPAALQAIVDEAIAQTGAASPKEMGKVMGAVMAKVAGRADGAAVNALVRARLGG